MAGRDAKREGFQLPIHRLRRLVILGLVALTSGVTAAPLGRSASLAEGQAPAAEVAKGRELFSSTGLSGDGLWSCASCHPNNGHSDNKTYVGVEVVPDGDPRGRSTPTLWGVGTRQAISWAGTAPSLQANIRGIIVNRMKGAEPSPETLAALVSYVTSLGYPPTRT